jgi:hypothetical protein
MTYVPLNLDVYTAAYAGAIAGIGIPNGAFITDPVESDYAPVTVVSAVYAQAVDTAWGAVSANTYDIEAITDASCNLFVRGPGCPIGGAIITQDNWTIVATALVALIREGDATASTGGITFPPIPTGGGGSSPFPLGSHILCASPVFGSDTTGDGTLAKPYATIGKCYSVASPTASDTEIWEVILFPGDFTENVAIRPFIDLIGWQVSTLSNGNPPVILSGVVTLDATFAAPGSVTNLANLGITNSLATALDFIGISSVAGTVSFTNCVIQDNIVLTLGFASNTVEFHDCICFSAVTQTGGAFTMWNTTVDGGMLIEGGAGLGPSFAAYGGTCLGDFTADASHNTTGDPFYVVLDSFSIRGTLNITSNDDVTPTIVSDYGATSENPVLVGSLAGLSPQMRVTDVFTIPSGTAITTAASTAIPFIVDPAKLGTTNIETLLNTANCIGSQWNDIFSVHKCTVSFQFYQSGGDNLVVVNIYSPGAPFTTADGLTVNWGAWLPFTFTP